MTRWNIDPTHSEINFKVKHLVVSTVSGTFRRFNATIDSAKEDFTDAAVAFEADVDSIDTKNEHCAHGFRTTFSTLCHHEEHKEAKAWDGDVIELQLAHLESSTVKAIYKRHGPLALIGPRTKLMQHWADRVDSWLDHKKVVPMKPGLTISS